MTILEELWTILQISKGGVNGPEGSYDRAMNPTFHQAGAGETPCAPAGAAGARGELAARIARAASADGETEPLEGIHAGGAGRIQMDGEAGCSRDNL